MGHTRRLTMGQALVEFLTQQYTSRDGVEQPFFAGVFTIFGHGIVAGLGQALLQARDRLPCYFPRNEQAMVHTAVGFAKMSNRRRTLACASSIGPGATNMLTGAAVATINCQMLNCVGIADPAGNSSSSEASSARWWKEKPSHQAIQSGIWIMSRSGPMNSAPMSSI